MHFLGKHAYRFEDKKELLYVTLNYIRGIYMKRLLLLMVVLLLLGMGLSALLSSSGEDDLHQADLPWKIELSESGATRVFGLDVGRITLKEMMLSLHKIAEVNVFKDKQGKLNIEAFFSRSKVGIFDATVIADLEADQLELERFISMLKRSDRKGTPSGSWKYELAEDSVKVANDMRVWRLVYMPAANYDGVTIQKQFGEPASKEDLGDGLIYWYYPKKSVVVLEDQNGREIFYYVAPDEYDALLKALPKEKPEIE